MRAVVFGLIGAVLAVGGARAGTCKLDGLSLVAERAEQSPEDAWRAKGPERPDLIGVPFKVVRAASYFDHTAKTLPRPTGADGKVFVVIEGAGERFTVEQTYDGRTIPEETAVSYPADSRSAAEAPWGKRAAKAEAARVSGFFEVFSGPLNGLILKPTNCS
ncbi:hypothetical protein MKK68_03870 [Methylobacterium sp. E-016]|uniref:hypothetical protein n=1 Tax=Methylobacterium sp. E-016 TaxID=2836556 RepID=UPI001FB89EE0|nr:hypothetical protein [Methylobacterium sp. E-016]MCJ2074789.1 hypothetical protein [Methylobacterium sp. E-016]